jgi:hypothetical protein
MSDYLGDKLLSLNLNYVVEFGGVLLYLNMSHQKR